MKTPLQTRRAFLSTGLKGISLLAAAGYAPTFLTRTAEAVGAATDSRILVVLQLSGGNDGLNTVVPFSDDLYHKARPTIGLAEADVFKVSDRLGLHPALKAVKAQFDEGRVAIVENVGYPNPNRSHFRSMEIWHTGADDTQGREVTGWIGRYFDAQCAGADPHRIAELGTIGMNFGKVMPQSYRNSSNVGISLDNPDTFLWNPSGETLGLAKAQEAIFARINKPQDGAMSGMKRSMEQLGGISPDQPGAIDFLRNTALNAVVAGERIREILAKGKESATYPRTNLAQQLKMIGKLIAANFPTRVYYVTLGGFDTHQQQLGTQERLLGDFSESVHAFYEDLRQQRNSDKVMLMAFSEFGRRVAENGSAGTDHGAAAPLFVFGEKIKGGVHGVPPDLQNLTDGDIRQQIDFRQVYAAVLNGWLETSPEKVLGKNYEKVPFV
jgi:uncharacterized protein (DUF1501 family)